MKAKPNQEQVPGGRWEKQRGFTNKGTREKKKVSRIIQDQDSEVEQAEVRDTKTILQRAIGYETV